MYWSPTVILADKAAKLTDVGFVVESSASGLVEEWRLVMVGTPVVVSARVQVRSKGHPLVTGRVAIEVLS